MVVVLFVAATSALLVDFFERDSDSSVCADEFDIFCLGFGLLCMMVLLVLLFVLCNVLSYCGFRREYGNVFGKI